MTRQGLLAFVVSGVAAGVLVPACGGPTFPSGGFVNCGSVTPSAAACSVTVPDPGPQVELPCPTPEEFELVRSEVPVRVHADVSAGVLACRAADGSVDLTVVENQIYQALLFLRRVRFDRPLPWTDLPVYDWLRAAIPFGMVLESSGLSHSCLNCPGPIHVVYPFYESVRPTVETLPFTLFVHEARHAEGYPHTCQRNESGQLTWDKSVSEMGGYGVHYALAYWIGHYSDQPPAVRDHYRRHAAEMLRTVFCCECGKGSTAGAAPAGPLVVRPGL